METNISVRNITFNSRDKILKSFKIFRLQKLEKRKIDCEENETA